MDSTKTPTSKSTTDHHSSSKVQLPKNHFHSHVLMDKVSPTRPVVSLVNLCTMVHTLSKTPKELMKMEMLSDKSPLGKKNFRSFFLFLKVLLIVNYRTSKPEKGC